MFREVETKKKGGARVLRVYRIRTKHRRGIIAWSPSMKDVREKIKGLDEDEIVIEELKVTATRKGLCAAMNEVIAFDNPFKK